MNWYKRSNLAYNAFRNLSSTLLSKTPSLSNSSSCFRHEVVPECHTRLYSGRNTDFKLNSISGSSSISSKLGFCNAVRKFSSKLLHKTPIHPPNPRPNLSKIGFKLNSISGSPSISSKLGFCSNFRSNQSSLVFRRNYYVDMNQVHHFKPRGYKNWIQNPRHMLIVVVVGTGVVITVYAGNSEVIPYTKRKHFVLLSRNLERQIGEQQFNEMKKGFKGKILPAIHPESVRVRLIAKDIIEALQRGLSHERVWSDPGYASESEKRGESDGYESVRALGEAVEGDGGWNKEEVLDDSWVKESRKEGGKKGEKADTEHLKGMKWEVLVVNEPVVNAFCLPGGKIVVFTGLLNHFRSDAEVATIIGHEVGHVIARHSAEQITKNMWSAILQLVLYQYIMPDLVNAMSTFLLKLPFSRKMEMEADYIGLLLTASAGYDPRVAPQVYEKLGRLSGESTLRDYLSTHPSGKTRAKLLANAQVMDEALALYREANTGRGIEGFL